MSRSVPVQLLLHSSAQIGAQVEESGPETVRHDQGPGPGATRLWFGRYKGTRLDELPEGYKRALLGYVKKIPYPNVSSFTNERINMWFVAVLHELIITEPRWAGSCSSSRSCTRSLKSSRGARLSRYSLLSTMPNTLSTTMSRVLR